MNIRFAGVWSVISVLYISHAAVIAFRIILLEPNGEEAWTFASDMNGPTRNMIPTIRACRPACLDSCVPW